MAAESRGPAGGWGGLRPWSELLSGALLDALQAWNDTGEALLGPSGDPAAAGLELDAFWALAAELAERTQQELGSDYEVLYQTPQGAWRWARPQRDGGSNHRRE